MGVWVLFFLVESGFSIVNFENDYRAALTDLSLEGILHSKQFTTIQSLIIICMTPNLAEFKNSGEPKICYFR